jgi:hypothetical protein
MTRPFAGCDDCGSPALCAPAERCTRRSPLYSSDVPAIDRAGQADQEAARQQLSEVLARVVDDYLDNCGTLDEVDSHDLGQQLAAVVLERGMPPGVHYVPGNPAVRGWGH